MQPFLALFWRRKKNQLDAASLTDTRSIIHGAVKLPLLLPPLLLQRAPHRKCQRRMLAKSKKVTTATTTAATTTTHYCLPPLHGKKVRAKTDTFAFIFQVFAAKCERPTHINNAQSKREGQMKGKG